jgi:hypothetical protein
MNFEQMTDEELEKLGGKAILERLLLVEGTPEHKEAQARYKEIEAEVVRRGMKRVYGTSK